MKTNGFTLGLDLGVTSIGWSLVDFTNQQIVAANARIFDAPMELAKYEAGESGSSNAVQRRQSIHQGRQLARRKGRHRDLYIALQDVNLLPYAGKRAEFRHARLTDLDDELVKIWRPKIKADAPEIADPGQIVPYYLRHLALTSRLSERELGRALYHLGQRRGFKSNRKEGRSGSDITEDEKEKSRIKSGIKTLQRELNDSGLTLGQHLSRINPHTAALRNRKRGNIDEIWVGRDMFEDEFDRIWTAQSQFHCAILTPDFKKRIERLMFWQRKVSAGKPGQCELEKKEIRAPRSSLLAQHFRLLQILNNIKLRETRASAKRNLTLEERNKLLAILSTHIHTTQGKKREEKFGLPFTEVKNRLGYPKAQINLDDGDDGTFLYGNRTNAILFRAFGPEHWNPMDRKERQRIARKWFTEQSPKRLREIAQTRWGLSPENAVWVASLEPEDGYASLSHKAMLKLLPFMEEQMLTYPEAVKAAGYSNTRPELDYLPPVDNVLSQIPNPVVRRALSELRGVLNEIIRIHGRPAQIRIELARDLKRNAEQRKKLQKGQKENAAERNLVRTDLRRINVAVTGSTMEKMRLYRRATKCVYCGEYLGNPEQIFQQDSGVQVEHILPRRCQDNSTANKILAHFSCNQKKGDRTPRQAFDRDDNQKDWQDMLDRVRALDIEPLWERFTITDDALASFSARHLADTRYISKLSTQYVEVLYGGRDSQLPWEDRAHRCVFASSGSITSKLFKRWGLNKLLKNDYQRAMEEAKDQDGKIDRPDDSKNRTDHRHHAIDAIIIALTSEKTIQQITRDMQQHDTASGYPEPRYFRPPWPQHGEIRDRIRSFRAEVEAAINSNKVSHRVNHKLNGKLHDANEHSPIVGNGKYTFHRTPIHTMTWEQIADTNNWISRAVLKAIDRQITALSLPRDKKLAALEKNPPYIEKNGCKIFIRKVRRAIASSSLISLDRRLGTPSIEPGENHHFVLRKRLNKKGDEEWYMLPPVTRLEAMRRKDQAKRREENTFRLVDDSDGPEHSFVMYLMKGDAVEMDDPVHGGRDIYILKKMSYSRSNNVYDVTFQRHNFSMPTAKALGIKDKDLQEIMRKNRDRVRVTTIDYLRQWNCRKVFLSPLGKVTELRSHD